MSPAPRPKQRRPAPAPARRPATPRRPPTPKPVAPERAVQTYRTSGVVKTVLRDAKFLVVTEQGMEVIAQAAGRMRRGRRIRILAGDAVDIEVSLYDTTRGRIVWRHV